ncbi:MULTISPECIES: base excision DNA repair protein [Halomicrobium]|uniref:HhH-GPD family protein n=2 Tax=Halomicrobium mukohataei TaxID=57705 RepID=C7NXZ4_HALMD|nr:MULTISPECIES: base excision DNA repair protein [Halomicrobium]ACV46582.1 HhH-GPD family protein [Halomicrobium mukohataei DSM 12286]QCD65122.1 hypothetical protein E5139_05500 [Halomicrobium mukohataei]QFR19928.1 hypothetical protein GBQ70_05495 [Halomicrobium sp. ZPS1]
MGLRLPFGKTEVSAEEIDSLVDRDLAVEHAKTGNVNQPEERIQEFIETVPELLSWLEANGRVYLWRETTDPWKVYLAEILLQRTRGNAVEKIYDDVLRQFPDPETLVEATEGEIEDVVRSLGFVNHRTRTLTEVGEIFTEDFGGEVPGSLDKLKRPWRVGDYSARATQLFAREQPMALVDSNFARVIGRVLGYEMPSQPHKSDDVYALMEALTPDDPDLARSFNLAILDLGALVCTSEDPDCPSCPLNSACSYYESEQGRPD